MSFAGPTKCRRDPRTSLSTMELPAAAPTRGVHTQEHRSWRMGAMRLASRTLPGMYGYILLMMTEVVSFSFSLRVFNVFTDTQMQASLGSKLGLFTVCSLFGWLGTTEQHLNSKIMLHTHTSSFLYPFQPWTFIETLVLALQSSYSIDTSGLKRGSLKRLDTETLLHGSEQ